MPPGALFSDLSDLFEDDGDVGTSVPPFPINLLPMPRNCNIDLFDDDDDDDDDDDEDEDDQQAVSAAADDATATALAAVEDEQAALEAEAADANALAARSLTGPARSASLAKAATASAKADDAAERAAVLRASLPVNGDTALSARISTNAAKRGSLNLIGDKAAAVDRVQSQKAMSLIETDRLDAARDVADANTAADRAISVRGRDDARLASLKASIRAKNASVRLSAVQAAADVAASPNATPVDIAAARSVRLSAVQATADAAKQNSLRLASIARQDQIAEINATTNAAGPAPTNGLNAAIANASRASFRASKSVSKADAAAADAAGLQAVANQMDPIGNNPAVMANVALSVRQSIRKSRAVQQAAESQYASAVTAAETTTDPNRLAQLQNIAATASRRASIASQKAAALSTALVAVQQEKSSINNVVAAVNQQLVAVTNDANRSSMLARRSRSIGITNPVVADQANRSAAAAENNAIAAAAQASALRETLSAIKLEERSATASGRFPSLAVRERASMVALRSAESSKAAAEVALAAATVQTQTAPNMAVQAAAAVDAQVLSAAVAEQDLKIAELKKSIAAIKSASLVGPAAVLADEKVAVVRESLDAAKTERSRYLAEAAAATANADAATNNPQLQQLALATAATATERASRAALRISALQSSLAAVKADAAAQAVNTASAAARLSMVQAKAARQSAEQIAAKSGRSTNNNIEVQKRASVVMAAVATAKADQAAANLLSAKASKADNVAAVLESKAAAVRQSAITAAQDVAVGQKQAVQARSRSVRASMVGSPSAPVLAAEAAGITNDVRSASRTVQTLRIDANRIQTAAAKARQTATILADQAASAAVEAKQAVSNVTAARRSLNAATGVSVTAARRLGTEVVAAALATATPAVVAASQTVISASRKSSIKNGKLSVPTAAKPGSAAAALTATGNDISDFEKVRDLGAGAFGTVFLSKSKSDGRMVVIKQIPKSGNTSVNDILNEVNVLKQLHPVCKQYLLCYDRFFEDAGNYYIGTEFAEDYFPLLDAVSFGKTGRKWTPPNDVLTIIIRNLIFGLQLIHQQGVAHRDIKPENVLVTKTGSIKYIDFGLSCLLQGCSNLGIAGTPEYMAPELVVVSMAIDGPTTLRSLQSTDIWSLGIVIYELINGHTPFSLWIYAQLAQGNFKRSVDVMVEVGQFLSAFNYRNPNDTLAVENKAVETAVVQLGGVAGINLSLTTFLALNPSNRSLPSLAAVP